MAPLNEEVNKGPGAKGGSGGNDQGGQGGGNVPPQPVEMTTVPASLLIEMQKQMAKNEQDNADLKAKLAGIEVLMEEDKDTVSEPALRKKKSFEPAFRTVKLRKYPMMKDHNNQGYVVGWTDRGAYEEVTVTPMGPQKILYIDLIFAGHEKNEEGKTQAEKVNYIDFLNNSTVERFKIIESKREPNEVATGEDIDIVVFDPQHGLVSTGEKIDGYTVFTNVQHQVSIPEVNNGAPMWIDATYCN